MVLNPIGGLIGGITGLMGGGTNAASNVSIPGIPGIPGGGGPNYEAILARMEASQAAALDFQQRANDMNNRHQVTSRALSDAAQAVAASANNARYS